MVEVLTFQPWLVYFFGRQQRETCALRNSCTLYKQERAFKSIDSKLLLHHRSALYNILCARQFFLFAHHPSPVCVIRIPGPTTLIKYIYLTVNNIRITQRAMREIDHQKMGVRALM